MSEQVSDNSLANKRIARNSLFMSIRMVIVLCITLYTTRAILSVLGVEDYGIYNVVGGFVSMFAFLNTSLSNGIQRFYNYELAKNGIEGANRVYNISLRIQFILSIILVLIIELIGVWYIANKMVIPIGRLYAAQWIFQFIIVSLVLTIMQAPYIAAVMSHERMDFYAIVCVFDAILKLIIVFLLPVIGGDHLIWYGLLWMVISAFDLICYYIYARRNFKEIRIKKTKDKYLLRSMLGFSGWNMFGSVSSILREQGLSLILNLFFGPVVNAARGVANQINGGISSFVQNITTPVRPQVIQSYAQGNINRTLNLAYSISKFSCYFLTVMALPICLEITTILKIWLGENVPDHTAAFAIIIIISSYQGNLNSATSAIVHATGKMKNYQFWCSTVKIISVPVGFILLKFGMTPEIALWMVVLFDMMGHFVGLIVLKSLIRFSIVNYIYEVMLPIILVIIIPLVITYPFHTLIQNSLVRFIIVLIISVISVSSCAYFIGLDKSEKSLLKNMTYSLTNKFVKRA